MKGSFSSILAAQTSMEGLLALPRFDGETYNHQEDNKRLSKQYDRVFRYMNDGQWHTLSEISGNLNIPESSVSARIRDMRKERFGRHSIDKHRKSKGLWEYRLMV